MRRLACLGLFLFACNQGAAKPQDKPARPRDGGATIDADPSKLEGAAIYKTLCAQCHGPDAKGYKADNAPSLVNKTFLESATDEFIHKSIATGRPGTSMAGYAREIGGPGGLPPGPAGKLPPGPLRCPPCRRPALCGAEGRTGT